MTIISKKLTTFTLLSLLAIGGLVWAGLWNPTTDTSTPNFVTLEDVYQAVETMTAASTTHSVSTSSSVTSTMHTLEDISNAISSVMVPDVGDVATGTIYGNQPSNHYLMGTMVDCASGTNATGTVYTSTTTSDKLNPSGNPAGTMVTLEDLYQKAYLFKDYPYGTSVPPHDLSTSSSPSGSMHTLQDLFDELTGINFPETNQVRQGILFGQASNPMVGTYACSPATAPASISLSVGGTNPVGGVTNVLMPAAGGTDTTGQVTGWISGSADTIKFTVVDTSPASSTITIDSSPYTSGSDYTITSTSSLTIVVTTSESGMATEVRMFNIGIIAAPPSLVTTNYSGSLSFPRAIAYANATGYMWTTNLNSNSIVRVAPDGTMNSYPFIGNWGADIAYDGTNMWVTGTNDFSVVKVTPTGLMTKYDLGQYKYPYAIAFDGTNMWVVNSDGSVNEIAPNGTIIGTYSGILPSGTICYSIAFDGTNMWTANYFGHSVTKISPSGSATTYSISGDPKTIVFDGTNLWTMNYDDNSVTKITLDGNSTTYTGSLSGPYSGASDGTNMWITDSTSNSITKVTPSGVMTTYSLNNSLGCIFLSIVHNIVDKF